MKTLQALLFLCFMIFYTNANSTPVTLPYSKTSWEDSDITADNDWSAITGWEGYIGNSNSGESLNATYRIIDTTADSLSVDADEPVHPSSYISNPSFGVIEFREGPIVALLGNLTVPYLVLYVSNPLSCTITISFDILDLDFSTDDEVAEFALYVNSNDTQPTTFTNLYYQPDVTIPNSVQNTSVAASVTTFFEITRFVFMTSAKLEPIGITNFQVAMMPSPTAESRSNSPSPARSRTPSPSRSSSPTPPASASVTPSATPSVTASASVTTSSSPSVSVSPTPSITASPSVSATPSTVAIDSSSDIPTAVVAGTTAGGGSACMGIIVVGAVFWCRRKKKNTDSSTLTDTDDEMEETQSRVELSSSQSA